HYIHADAVKDKLQADKDGLWPMLPGSEKVELTIDGQKAVGTFKLSADKKTNITLSFQTAYVNGNDKLLFTQPGPFRVDFGKDSVASRPPPTPPRANVPNPAPPAASPADVVFTSKPARDAQAKY